MNKIIFFILIKLINIIFLNISYAETYYQGIRFSCKEINNIQIGIDKKYIINKVGYPSILDLSNKKFIYIFYFKTSKNIQKYLILILEFNKNKLINIKKYKKN